MAAPEPIFEPRGTPFSVVGRLKALSDMGYQVDLLTYPFGEDVVLPGVRIIRIWKVPGIKRIKIGPSIAKLPIDFELCVLTFWKLLTGSYDLLHTHEEAGLWGTLFSRIFKTPHIYDMHSSLPQQLSNFEFTKSGLLIDLFKSMENWVLKYSSAVITICPDLRDHVASVLPERGSVLIENVIDYAMVFGEEEVPETVRSLKTKNRKIALYTGTFEPYQGLDLLIESAKHAISKNPHLFFLVVGGHADQVEMVKSMAKQAGLESSFHFTGQVSPQSIPGYVRLADLLVSPRKSGTNTPLKIYSYLRSGIPVVATRLLTHTQVLDDSISVLTDVTSEGFAEGILLASENSQDIQSRVKKAQDVADKTYSYPVYLERFQKVMALALERGV